MRICIICRMYIYIVCVFEHVSFSLSLWFSWSLFLSLSPPLSLPLSPFIYIYIYQYVADYMYRDGSAISSIVNLQRRHKKCRANKLTYE